MWLRAEAQAVRLPLVGRPEDMREQWDVRGEAGWWSMEKDRRTPSMRTCVRACVCVCVCVWVCGCVRVGQGWH